MIKFGDEQTEVLHVFIWFKSNYGLCCSVLTKQLDNETQILLRGEDQIGTTTFPLLLKQKQSENALTSPPDWR
jgi:hypothetical protein